LVLGPETERKQQDDKTKDSQFVLLTNYQVTKQEDLDGQDMYSTINDEDRKRSTAVGTSWRCVLLIWSSTGQRCCTAKCEISFN
jgi:hypothetical protein